jgi:hypothetical protein
MVASFKNLASANDATRAIEDSPSRVAGRRCAPLAASRAMPSCALDPRGSRAAGAKIFDRRSMNENRAIDRWRDEDRRASDGDS